MEINLFRGYRGIAAAGILCSLINILLTSQMNRHPDISRARFRCSLGNQAT